MVREKKMSKGKGFMKTLKVEWRSIRKPDRNEQVHGTLSTFGIAIVAALTISAFDSVFTALVGLFV